MHWQDRPYRISGKAGETKLFCACGKTNNPPYCDGSHKCSGKEPYKVTFEKDMTISICGCGKSKTLPYCDGSHRCGCHCSCK